MIVLKHKLLYNVNLLLMRWRYIKMVHFHFVRSYPNFCFYNVIILKRKWNDWVFKLWKTAKSTVLKMRFPVYKARETHIIASMKSLAFSYLSNLIKTQKMKCLLVTHRIVLKPCLCVFYNWNINWKTIGMPWPMFPSQIMKIYKKRNHKNNFKDWI